jgi:eukaryotic-like serine/threonine-protein kinase
MSEPPRDPPPPASPPVYAPLPAGTRLGQYEIVALLGDGKFGAVYQAVERITGLQVAIKTLQTQGFRDLVRLKEEAKRLAKIRDRNIVALHQYVRESEAGPLLVMEYVPGTTLYRHIAALDADDRFMAIAEGTGIILAVIKGTMAIHKHGMVHADLKAGNVMLSRDDEGTVIKILDFGLARDPDSTLAAHGKEALGTWGWMAPEQMEGTIDVFTDQYAIGVMLYGCLTGRRPFPFKDTISNQEMYDRTKRGDFPRPREIRPDLPEPLEAVVLRAMAVEPGNRYPTLLAMGQALLPFQGPTHPWTHFFATAASATG